MSYGRNAKVILSPGGILPNNLIYEQTQNGDQSQYVVLEKEKIVTKQFLQLGEAVIYQPLSPSPWLLPPTPEEYGDLNKLWTELHNFIYEHVDFEHEVQYDVMTAWVLASWVAERWDSVPYLWFTGPSNSGKTRCLDVLAYLGYRPLLSPSVSAASLYRALDLYHPTFLLDEFEMYEKMKELKAEVIGVLNAGYRRGQVILRADKSTEGSMTLRAFNAFGFKAISSIMPLPNATQGRTITFIMSKAVRKVKRLIEKDVAKVLRGKLLMYRLKNVFGPQPSGNPIDLPDGRLIELYTPLVLVAPPTVEEGILKYARGEYNQKIIEESETDEAKIFLTIIDMLREQPRAFIPQIDIRMKVNADLPEKEGLSKQRIGHILKRLGFSSKRGEGRLYEIIVDVNVIKRRAVRYLSSEELQLLNNIISSITSITTIKTIDTEATITSFQPKTVSSEASPSYPRIMDVMEDMVVMAKCEQCGASGKRHLMPGRGEVVLCNECARNFEGDI